MSGFDGYDPGILNRGAVIAEYHYRRSTRLLFIFFFIGLFGLGLDVIFFHKPIPGPDLKTRVAAVAVLILSLAILAFLVRQVILRKAAVVIASNGIQLDVSEFKAKTIFVPWESVVSVGLSMVRIELFWKLNFLVLAVTPGSQSRNGQVPTSN